VLTLHGAPIVSLVCYCDTCQEGSRRIETLPNAPVVREPDGGTAYVSYRKDRVTYEKGREVLEDVTNNTERVVASCCKSALLMRFDAARHWVAVYRTRFGPNAPPIQMRVCTSFLPDTVVLPDDVPAHRDYPAALVMKLVGSRLAMLLRRDP
jgi:hypothetical protein